MGRQSGVKAIGENNGPIESIERRAAWLYFELHLLEIIWRSIFHKWWYLPVPPADDSIDLREISIQSKE